MKGQPGRGPMARVLRALPEWYSDVGAGIVWIPSRLTSDSPPGTRGRRAVAKGAAKRLML